MAVRQSDYWIGDWRLEIGLQGIIIGRLDERGVSARLRVKKKG